MASERTTGVDSDILLDAGTNELEVLVFKMVDGWFGVNVAKVREVIKPQPATKSPAQHASVIGMFDIRGSVVPVVDLPWHLGLVTERASDRGFEGRVIITEFNGRRTGFWVDAVDRIHRVSWASIKPAPDFSNGVSTDDSISSTTGTLQLGDDLILMVDFESVADAIVFDEKLHIGKVADDLGVDRPSKRVLLAEDSPFMRKLLTDVFTRSGYTGLEVHADGQSAWDAMQAKPHGIDAVVSDIEMPRLDGLTLAKKIKESAHFTGVPVMLFSSLISTDNMKKGKQVGVDVQVPKPKLEEMVRLVDRLVSGETIEPSDETFQRAA